MSKYSGISVITPSLNQGRFIERTIQSVLEQKTDDPVEFIVMDGGSSDGTHGILEKYAGLLKWYSEKDSGQSEAVNKAVARASGEIIGWLNSDDVYLPGALQKVAEHFGLHPQCQWLIGKCRIIDEDDRETRKALTRYKNLFMKRFSYNALLVENYISQPAVFFRKELFETAGGLHPDRPLAMDYDLWLRFARISSPCMINEYLAGFRVHKYSKSSTSPAEQFQEQVDIHKSHDRRKIPLLLHYLNAWKNVAGYRLMKLLKL